MERNVMRFVWRLGTVCIGIGGENVIVVIVIVIVDRGSKIETKFGLCNRHCQLFLTSVHPFSVMH